MRELKYVYDEYSPDTVPHEEFNEFHTLSVFLGAYLIYSGSPEFSSYLDFIKAKNLIKECLDNAFRWPYITKAHLFLRTKLNENTVSAAYISKRQIRKLGYSGIGCRRMYPKVGTVIQNEMFRLVFYTKEFEQVKKVFLEYLYKKLCMIDPEGRYLDRINGDGAANFVFRKFIAFQFHLLSGPRGRFDLLRELEVNTYQEIQRTFNERGEHNARQQNIYFE